MDALALALWVLVFPAIAAVIAGGILGIFDETVPDSSGEVERV